MPQKPSAGSATEPDNSSAAAGSADSSSAKKASPTLPTDGAILAFAYFITRFPNQVCTLLGHENIAAALPELVYTLVGNSGYKTLGQALADSRAKANSLAGVLQQLAQVTIQHVISQTSTTEDNSGGAAASTRHLYDDLLQAFNQQAQLEHNVVFSESFKTHKNQLRATTSAQRVIASYVHAIRQTAQPLISTDAEAALAHTTSSPLTSVVEPFNIDTSTIKIPTVTCSSAPALHQALHQLLIQNGPKLIMQARLLEAHEDTLTVLRKSLKQAEKLADWAGHYHRLKKQALRNGKKTGNLVAELNAAIKTIQNKISKPSTATNLGDDHNLILVSAFNQCLTHLKTKTIDQDQYNQAAGVGKENLQTLPPLVQMNVYLANIQRLDKMQAFALPQRSARTATQCNYAAKAVADHQIQHDIFIQYNTTKKAIAEQHRNKAASRIVPRRDPNQARRPRAGTTESAPATPQQEQQTATRRRAQTAPDGRKPRKDPFAWMKRQARAASEAAKRLFSPHKEQQKQPRPH